MRLHGHATTWSTHTGVGRTQKGAGWYEELRAWWVAHKAMRREARLAALSARWDAKREVFKPLRAEAAAEMAAAQGILSMATLLYGLTR